MKRTMAEENISDKEFPPDLVTITTAITPVIVKAISSGSPEVKFQRSASESVLVIAPNPQVKSPKPPMPQVQESQPVIVKNTNAFIVQNYNRNINSGQSVIKSTKSVEWKLTWSNASSNRDAENSNDSCSILTANSDNSMDSVKTPLGSTLSNDKTDYKLFDENEDSRDSKTEDSISSGCSTNKKELSRDARNRAEKQRRDKLNNSINELSTLVPLVCESTKKIDKTGVLRLTAHELRKEHVFGNSMASCDDTFTPKIMNAFMNLMDGCLFTSTCMGIIVVVSPNIEEYLGHCEVDLLGTSIFSLCHPDDVEVFKTNLLPHEAQLGNRGQLLPNHLSPEEFTKREKQRCFHVRLIRTGTRADPNMYELCKITGFLRRSDRAHLSTTPPKRRHRQRNEENSLRSGNDVVFIGLIQPVRHDTSIHRFFEFSNEEYKTRHLTDGRIISCDQRISLVAGYMTSEVNGVSAFSFMHKDDVRWVIIALRQVYDSSKYYGESYYRLLSKNGEFIYMKTQGYLEVGNKNDVQSFVCLNQRLTEETGKHMIAKMKHKYGVILDGLNDFVTNGNATSSQENIEDPRKLEQAIVHLITNLMPKNDKGGNSENTKRKSFSIIAPQADTIKLTIEKSFTAMGKPIKNMNELPAITCDEEPSTSKKSSFELNTIDDFSSNEYLADVIDKMDLFNEKKTTLERSPDYNGSLLSGAEILHQPSTSPKVYHNFVSNVDKNDTVAIKSNGNDTNSGESTAENFKNILSYDIIDSHFKTDDFSSANKILTNANMQVDTAANKSDPLIGSHPHKDHNSGTERNSSVAHKRTFSGDNNYTMSTIAKRITSIHANNSEEILNVCDTIFPNYSDNVNIMRPNDSLSGGFDHFIDELTDPNSDLGIVVPRSLVALGSSITELDDTVTHINPVYNQEPNNFSDIIISHSENKNILENIMSEHHSTDEEAVKDSDM